MPTITTQPLKRRSERAPDETFSPEELAAILRDASSRQSAREVASLDQALETARELGIDEKHVLAAVETHRQRLERRETLHGLTLRERRKLARLAWSAALVTAIVTIAAGWNIAQLALIGLSIGAVAQGFRWLRAEIRERTDGGT